MNKQSSSPVTVGTMREIYSSENTIITDYLLLAKELEKRGRDNFLQTIQQKSEEVIKSTISDSSEPRLVYESQPVISQQEESTRPTSSKKVSLGPVVNPPEPKSLENELFPGISYSFSTTLTPYQAFQSNQLESMLDYSISSMNHFKPSYAYQKNSFNYRGPEFSSNRNVNYAKYLH